MKLVVFGSGSWGCALAQCAQENVEVLVYCRTEKEAEKINQNAPNKYMPEIKFNFKATSNLKIASLFSDIYFIAIPVKHIREFLINLKQVNPNPKIIVSGSKGFEINSHKLPTEIIEEFFPNANIGALTGPSQAESLLNKAPTAVTITGNDLTREITKRILSTKYFKLYDCNDVFGAQLYAAAKNVYAIGAGALDANKALDNTKAAYITRSLFELQLLGGKMNAEQETIFSLAGLGDFLVTCYSNNSRNWSYGKYLVSNDIKDKPTMVVEGLNTIHTLIYFKNKYNVRMPILTELENLIMKKKTPDEVYESLAIFKG